MARIGSRPGKHQNSERIVKWHAPCIIEAQNPRFIFMEYSKSWSLILQLLWETYSNQENYKTHVCIHGEYSKSWSGILKLFWEDMFKQHSKSRSVTLQFLWEYIYKQETLQYPRCYPWSILKIWSVFLIFVWENIFKQESRQNPRFYSWSILKLVSDSEILVG